MTLVKKPLSNPDQVIDDMIAHVLNEVVDQVVEMHDDIVDPWDLAEDKPSFEPEAERLPDGSAVLRVLMLADSAESATLSVWQLLNRGTSERPMHVDGAWISKTDPASPLVSGPGRGNTTGIYLPWAAGIEGREFDVAVAEHLETLADREVRIAGEKALDKEFSSG